MEDKRTTGQIIKNIAVLVGVLAIDLLAPNGIALLNSNHSAILNTILMLLVWVVYGIGAYIAYHYYKHNGYGRIRKLTKKDVWITISCFLSALVVELLLNAANIMINNQATSANNTEIINILSRNNFALVGMGIAIIFISPVIEELIFRGLLIDTLFPKNAFWVPIAVSGFIFSLGHLTTTWISFLTYVMLGCFMAYAYRKSENLMTSILFHFINNLLSGIPILIMVISNH